MPGEKQQTALAAERVVKSAALGSLALAAGGVRITLPFGMRTAAAAVQQAMRNEEDIKSSGAPARSTAAVAVLCVCMCKR